MALVPEMSVKELAGLKESDAEFVILDVRNPDEYQLCNLGGLLIPYTDLEARYQELDPEQCIIIHCHAGGRSRRATEFLLSKGFKKVFNLQGGITAWANEIDPKMPKY